MGLLFWEMGRRQNGETPDNSCSRCAAKDDRALLLTGTKNNIATGCRRSCS